MKKEEEKKADMQELRDLIKSNLHRDENLMIQLVFKYLKRQGKIYKKDIYPLNDEIKTQEFTINELSDIHYNGEEFLFINIKNWHCEGIKKHLMPQLLERNLIHDYSQKTPYKIDVWHF